MRRIYLVLLCLLLPVRVAADGGITVDSLRTKVAERMAYLSVRYGLIWSPGSAPTVRVDFPDSARSIIDLMRPASFIYVPSTIWFNPLMYAQPESLNASQYAMVKLLRRVDVGLDRLLDHELTHAYTCLIFRRLTGLPGPRIGHQHYGANRLAHDILWEGLASAAERDSLPPPQLDTYWPVTFDLDHPDGLIGSMLWEDWVYEGGWQLLAPMVQRYSLPVMVEYVIRHPLVIQRNKVRRSVLKWRQTAIKDLEAMHLTFE